MTRSKDEVYATIRWNLDLTKGSEGAGVRNDTVWMCDQMRAGQLYTRKIFDTLEEARSFQQHMLEAEPDAFFNVQSIEARQVWN